MKKSIREHFENKREKEKMDRIKNIKKREINKTENKTSRSQRGQHNG